MTKFDDIRKLTAEQNKNLLNKMDNVNLKFSTRK